jgi:hypothetical protein
MPNKALQQPNSCVAELERYANITLTSMKLFVSGAPGDFNASLNFMPDQLSGYAEGYKLAADRLMQQLVNDPVELDYLIYPLMFLYRQHLELRFKEISRAGHRIDNSARISQIHFTS